MCGIGMELELYLTTALMILGSSGLVLATIHFKDDLKDIFKKEEKNVIR